MTRASRRAGQDGYILVAVLGVMLLLTGFMAAGSLLLRSALDTVRVADADVAMVGLTRGGLELTAYQLFVIKASPPAVDARRIKFGGGSVAPRIVDEGGKADLNASDPKLLAAVFKAADLDSRTADELVAWIVQMRGADRNPSAEAQPQPQSQAMPASTDAAATPPQEAQAAAPPQQAAPAAGPKKMLRGFQSVDQLLDFPDLSRSDLHALRPLLTVYNPDGKINILSATKDMLAAIPGLSSADVEVILARRSDADKTAIDNLSSSLQNAKDYTKTDYGPAFSVRIDAISATGRKKTINAVVAASKSPNDPYYVLDWWE